MNILKYIANFSLLAFSVLSLWNCVGAKQYKTSEPMEITKVYFQNVDSVKTIYVVANVKQDIILEHVYFKGKQARLEQVNDSLFIGHFFKDSLKKTDVIMTNEPYGEYGNTLPHLSEKSPFDLKENECMIAYKVGDEVHFFKYSNVEKR